MPPTDPAPSPPAAPAAPPRAARAWLLALAAGLVAGPIAWLGGEATLGAIRPPRQAVQSKGMTLQVADRWDEAQAAAQNAALAAAILGGAVGAALGGAGGWAGGWRRRTLGVAGVGLIVGALGSAAMAAATLTPYNAYRYQHPDEASRDLVLPLLIHAATWGVAGLAGGLAFGLGGRADRGLVAKLALGGLAGAAAGAALVDLAGSALFDMDNGTALVAATATARFAERLAVALGAAVGVALAATDRRATPAPAGSPT